MVDGALKMSKRRRVEDPGPTTAILENEAEPFNEKQMRLVKALMFGTPTDDGGAMLSNEMLESENVAYDWDEISTTDCRATREVFLPPPICPLPLRNTKFDISIEERTRIAAVEEPPKAEVVALADGGTVIQTGVELASRVGCAEIVHVSQNGLKTA